MLEEKELHDKINATPAAKVSKEYIEGRISDVNYTKLGDTVTLAQIILDNGYSVRGESACVNAENYDQEIGETISYKNAFNKLWPLFGFLLAETQFKNMGE